MSNNNGHDNLNFQFNNGGLPIEGTENLMFNTQPAKGCTFILIFIEELKRSDCAVELVKLVSQLDYNKIS